MSAECPCCGWTGEKFSKFHSRQNARCPDCFSKERHRYLYLFLQSYLPKEKEIRVLHIAPEETIKNLFTSYSNIEYLSIDIDPKRLNPMQKEDITSLSFKRPYFDFLFCCHVLEHVEDDKKAISEMYRVLNPGGEAIIQVPLFNLETTLEGPLNPKERERVYGQKDHLRAYGADYQNKLEYGGFEVQVINFLKEIKKEQIERFKLIHNVKGTSIDGKSQEDIYLCKKPKE